MWACYTSGAEELQRLSRTMHMEYICYRTLTRAWRIASASRSACKWNSWPTQPIVYWRMWYFDILPRSRLTWSLGLDMKPSDLLATSDISMGFRYCMAHRSDTLANSIMSCINRCCQRLCACDSRFHIAQAKTTIEILQGLRTVLKTTPYLRADGKALHRTCARTRHSKPH